MGDLLNNYKKYALDDSSSTPAYMAIVDCQRCHANTAPIEIWATGPCHCCDNCNWPMDKADGD